MTVNKWFDVIADVCFYLTIIACGLTIWLVLQDQMVWAFTSMIVTSMIAIVGWTTWYSQKVRRAYTPIIKLDIEMIDKMIRYWRLQKILAQNKGDVEEVLIASCYIDAFQSMRLNHGLPQLPKENSDG